MKTPILSFSGYANSGKTTTLVKVVGKLVEKGYKIAALKHHGHKSLNEIPNKLKDTDKIRIAGANWVKLIVGQVNIDEDLKYLDNLGYDLILLEGFKSLPYPKLFFLNDDFSDEKLEFKNIIGIVKAVDENKIEEYPDFNYCDVESIVKFTEKSFLKGD